ncbi:hypothetical protein [Nonomuraea candida]|uniref:hypothetical protein n=1 Tax=Nonomuraea candida TaxID=359159 RepID=UPI0005BCD81F|nr:hypothetical protein [Nonomuraea candida]
MTPHECARPAYGDDRRPWQCPECGCLWEPLPAAAVAPPAPPAPARPRVTRNGVIIAIGIVSGAVCLVALTVSREAFIVSICAVGFAVLAYSAWGLFHDDEDDEDEW